jgi:methyl-accepting chemotaxis protein
MNKKILYKFLVPIVSLLFLTITVSIFIISSNVEDSINESVNQEASLSLQFVNEFLQSTDDLVMEQVNSGMRVLKQFGNNLGPIKQGEEIYFSSKSAPDLIFGEVNQGKNYELVDNLKELVGGTATLFSRSGSEFVRITTNVQKNDGSRAVGTILNPNGRAFEKINNKQAYYGLVNILGKPYLTGYEPMFDINNDVVGIWYVGYQLSSLSKVKELITNTKILSNGFAAILDNNGEAIFHPEHFTSEQVKDLVVNPIQEDENWIMTEKDFEKWGYKAVILVPESDIAENISSARNSVIFWGILVGVLLIGFVSFLVISLIVRPVIAISTAAKKFSDGDSNVFIESKSSDEIGYLAKSFNNMITSIRESINEINQKSEIAESAAAEAKTAKEEALSQQEYLSNSVDELLIQMDKFAGGDLTVKLESKNDDAIGKLFKGFNSAVENIKKMIINVTEAVQSTTSASNEISSSAEEMAAGAQEQSAQTAEVASAVEQMTKTILETANNSSLASDAASNSRDQANVGFDKVNHSKQGMNKIVDSTQQTSKIIKSLAGKTDQIGEIAQVIDDIADQTNLLALNAAIEAARAGEQGRGFAVVADEVRKLAERTTKATKEIADTIKAIQHEAKDANNSMDEAGVAVAEGIKYNNEVENALNEILTSAKEVSSQIDQVAAASEEQSSAAEQISKNIEGINNVANESAVGIQQIAQSSEELNRLTENLQSIIKQFRIESYQMDSNTPIYN